MDERSHNQNLRKDIQACKHTRIRLQVYFACANSMSHCEIQTSEIYENNGLLLIVCIEVQLFGSIGVDFVNYQCNGWKHWLLSVQRFGPFDLQCEAILFYSNHSRGIFIEPLTFRRGMGGVKGPLFLGWKYKPPMIMMQISGFILWIWYNIWIYPLRHSDIWISHIEKSGF